LQHDYTTLQNLLTRLNPRKILDIGCGSGRLFPLYLSCGIREVYGQDISSQALAKARKRYDEAGEIIHLTQQTVTGLDFPHHYFDLVISNRVLQHIPSQSIGDYIRAIGHLGRFAYINESMLTDNVSPNDYKLFLHDYQHLFIEKGFQIVETGMIANETGVPQKWILFKSAG
jgi:ubiquinone/menaquinone biosynthesis C-methylase UbiE